MNDARAITGSLVDVRNVEEWRPVVGLEDLYEVSSHGRVRSLPRTIITRRPGRILKGGITTCGYRAVNLNGKCRSVSSVVAAAFVGPRPNGHHVCHNNGNRTDDQAVNLRYDTPKNNVADRRVHGTERYGTERYNAKLSDEQIKEIRAARGIIPQRALARRFRVAHQTIKQVQLGRTWRHV